MDKNGNTLLILKVYTICFINFVVVLKIVLYTYYDPLIRRKDNNPETQLNENILYSLLFIAKDVQFESAFTNK